MTTQALQRVVVRMLYDPLFVERVYADPTSATADLELTDTMRSWLVAPDRRAYGVDPLRRSRSLTALLEEYAVSAAVFVRRHDDAAARLDSYFSSEHFHRDLQAGVSLAASFGQWLLDSQVAAGVVRLEQAMAAARRSHEAGSVDASSLPTSHLALNAGVGVLRAPAGTVAAFAQALERLRQHPGGLHQAIFDPRLEIALPPEGEDEEGVLVDGHDGDLRLETMSVELAAVLEGAARPIAFDRFVERAAQVGATREDCLAIVGSFSADGVLVGFVAR